MSDIGELWDYRRRVSDIYAATRAEGPGEKAWFVWRDQRDLLFSTHPQSPIENRDGFRALPYFPYDDSWLVTATLESAPPAQAALEHSGDGSTKFTRAGTLRFEVDGTSLSLGAFWLASYGGGMFVPFRDVTNGTSTYGGGRYILDTAKGADLGSKGDDIILDFNYAYHPSCVHSDRWSCPLAPPSNQMPIAVEAGERLSEEPAAP